MRFTNPHIQNIRRSLWDALLWKFGYYSDLIPKTAPPEGFLYPANPSPFQRDLPSAVWIGHSTFLIQVKGMTLLTDPVWGSHCSPVPIKALRRLSAPPLSLTQLPPIDVVLLSHNHYDHLDAKTVRALHQLQPDILWIVPQKLSPWFHRRGVRKVEELSWWNSLNVKQAKVTAVPTQHFSGRTLWDTNRTHWNGYVFEIGQKRMYFTGDTGYNPHDFKAIGEKWPSMDLSLIPIGTYSPQKFMETVHIGPKEAVQIHLEVHSRLSLGMHWNTFCLSEEPLNRPPYDLYLSMKEKGLAYDRFLPIEIGTYVNW